jgi:hypothetical protein
MSDAPESTRSLATHLRRLADNASDQIDADRLSRAADLVEARAEVEAAVKRALEAAADTCADNTWRHEGDDAYSRGLDRGALEQASASAAAIRALASDPEALRRIVEGGE